MDKRGQFFLLAAVIISAVIISLNVGTNRADVSENPEDVYDFSYEVKREVSAVLDYEVYTGFDDDVNLTLFIDLLAEDIGDRSPGSQFIFIYGNRSDMNLRNYGSESVYADGVEVDGLENSLGRICLGDACQEIDKDISDFDSLSANIDIDSDRYNADDILVEIAGSGFIFPLSDYRQVIFIIKKDVGGDRYVSVA